MHIVPLYMQCFAGFCTSPVLVLSVNGRLLTPPGTPIFPLLDNETLLVNTAQRGGPNYILFEYIREVVTSR